MEILDNNIVTVRFDKNDFEDLIALIFKNKIKEYFSDIESVCIDDALETCKNEICEDDLIIAIEQMASEISAGKAELDDQEEFLTAVQHDCIHLDVKFKIR